ncbi:MAG: DNA polymerase III subunit alpha [Candidatus Promineifilaceae bacterium]
MPYSGSDGTDGTDGDMKGAPTFTHLEVHSQYTLLGATPSVQQLAEKASAAGFSHLPITDTNALYGAVAFHNACLKESVQPVIGMTISISPPPDAQIRSDYRLSAQAGVLVLLAKSRAGYRSLCQLSSMIQVSTERELLASRGLDLNDIAAHSEGLLCLSGGRRGWVERLIRYGAEDDARRYVARLGGIFGEDAFLSLEVNSPEDEEVAQEIEAVAQRFGLRTVAVQPVFCLDAGEYDKLRLLEAIRTNKPLSELSQDAGMNEPERALHWLDAEEVASRFGFLTEAYERVREVVSSCEPCLPDGRPIWPKLNLPEGKTPEGALADKARAGLRARYGISPPKKAQERLEHELNSIGRTGYTPLFIIVADIARHARDTGVPVSTRGSVANSLVAYCVGITTVDPIEHDLLFERFLNPARNTPPDIDLDFCSRRRDEVLEYVRQTYGEEQVSLVATISTMRPKSAVRETAKALSLDEGEIGRLAKKLPRGWHPDPRRRDRTSVDELLVELDNPKQREVVRRAYEIVGQPHHLSVHPGGVVITPGPLTDFVPVQMAPKGFLITQYDHLDLETLGLPKLDLLGISALTVMADATELVRKYHDPHFRLEDIHLQDQATGDLIESGKTIGVFQCESAGAQRTLRQLKARTVTDLAVANAFFKPGPATGGMAQAFIRRYRGEETVRYLHPALEPILNQTKGVLLFQEQILRVATEIAGLNWEQANQLRRGMSKFRPDEMEALQADFVTGCMRSSPGGPGFDSEQAAALWEQVLAFAGYGFNQGHATAYGDVSYRSAYLKNHWPAPFFCARLADWGGFHHPAIYTAEAIRLGINVRPPHINYSLRKFTLTYEGLGAGDLGLGVDDSPNFSDINHQHLTTDNHASGPQPQAPNTQSPILWMGLGQIRDLRRKSVRKIIDGRAEKPFGSLRDLLDRVPLQTKEISHLIQCGALDGLGSSRASLLAEAGDFQRAGSTKQMAFGFEEHAETTAETLEDRLKWEKVILGRPISVHPLDLIEPLPDDIVPLRELSNHGDSKIALLGVRLPGWTGGRGFFLGDGDTFITAQQDENAKTPEPWQPLHLLGRWRADEWGTQWFQIESITHLSN